MSSDTVPIPGEPQPDRETDSVRTDATGQARSQSAAELDWDFVREFILRRVTVEVRGSKYHYADAGILDELTQNACLRLHRATARPIDNLEGLLTTIARRTVMDYFKSEATRTKRFADLDDDEEGYPPGDTAATTPDHDPDADYRRARTLVRMMLQYWRREKQSTCLELWRSWKQKVQWKDVAASLGGKPTAHRKRWERCLSGFRELLARDSRLMDDLGVSRGP